LHQLFQDYISQYYLKPELIEPLKVEIIEVWNEINKENVELEKNYKEQLSEVNKKLDKIEEKHYVLEEMNKETFQKFYFKYKQEQKDASDQLANVASEISNPEAIAEKAISISTELNKAWASGDVKRKEQLQKLLFPEGIVYDLKNNAFRTDRVNVIFMLMAQLANNTGAKEKEQTNSLACLSLSAEREGFEPPDL
jgi:site-specific DNA recombinase